MFPIKFNENFLLVSFRDLSKRLMIGMNALTFTVLVDPDTLKWLKDFRVGDRQRFAALVCL